MAEAIVILIFLCAFALVWYALLYLIRHPNINIDLTPQVLAHEPELEEQITKVLTYLHNEEEATVESIGNLLGSDEIAEDVITLLEYRNLVTVFERDDELFIIKS